MLVAIPASLMILGCGEIPTGPPPPVLYPTTFEALIETLDSPGKVAKWAEEFVRYSNPYTGWVPPEGRDLAWSLAHDFWENRINRYGRGKCGSFAALMVVCARSHGYDCGILCYYWWDSTGAGSGHAVAWVQEYGGISIYSNHEYIQNVYKTKAEMQQYFIQHYTSENQCIMFADAYWENAIWYPK